MHSTRARLRRRSATRRSAQGQGRPHTLEIGPAATELALRADGGAPLMTHAGCVLGRLWESGGRASGRGRCRDGGPHNLGILRKLSECLLSFCTIRFLSGPSRLRARPLGGSMVLKNRLGSSWARYLGKAFLPVHSER